MSPNGLSAVAWNYWELSADQLVEAEAGGAQVEVQAFVLDHEAAHAAVAAVVVGMQLGCRRDLRRAGNPLDLLVLDRRMDALALDCQGNGGAVMPVRALIAARFKRVDGGVDHGQGVLARRQGWR